MHRPTNLRVRVPREMQFLALCGRFQSSGLHGMLNWFFTPKGDHNIRQSPIVSHEYKMPPKWKSKSVALKLAVNLHSRIEAVEHSTRCEKERGQANNDNFTSLSINQINIEIRDGFRLSRDKGLADQNCLTSYHVELREVYSGRSLVMPSLDMVSGYYVHCCPRLLSRTLSMCHAIDRHNSEGQHSVRYFVCAQREVHVLMPLEPCRHSKTVLITRLRCRHHVPNTSCFVLNLLGWSRFLSMGGKPSTSTGD